MKKSDIKNGMHVITNNGIEYVVISGVETSEQTETADVVMVQIGDCGGWMPFDKYDDDLHYCGKAYNKESYDISEVYAPKFYAYVLQPIFDVNDRFVKVWERPFVRKMTKAEIEDELGYEIEIIED